MKGPLTFQDYFIIEALKTLFLFYLSNHCNKDNEKFINFYSIIFQINTLNHDEIYRNLCEL